MSVSRYRGNDAPTSVAIALIALIAFSSMVTVARFRGILAMDYKRYEARIEHFCYLDMQKYYFCISKLILNSFSIHFVKDFSCSRI